MHENLAKDGVCITQIVKSEPQKEDAEETPSRLRVKPEREPKIRFGRLSVMLGTPKMQIIEWTSTNQHSRVRLALVSIVILQNY